MENRVRRTSHGDLQGGPQEVTRLFLKRVGNALYPDGDESVEALSHMPFGKTLRGEVDQPRSVKHMRLFFALCSRIAKGIGKPTEFVERAFKIETGHFDHYRLASGRDVMVLGSIAFHRMDQVAFKEFWERCIQIMYEKWQIDPASVNDLLEDRQ
jgi:hypothetical protein